MASNVEFKAHAESFEAMRDRCVAVGAQLLRQEEEVDTYFRAHDGRLKLREGSESGSKLIFYRRMDSPLARRSDFEIIPVSKDPARLRAVLSEAVGVHVQVLKTRAVYELGPARINVDRVEGLGPFVEVEVDVERCEDAAEAAVWAERLRQQLDVKARDIVPWSYSDLHVLKQSAARWRARLDDRLERRLFLIDGASCSGKTTLSQELVKSAKGRVSLVPRYCTRSPRPGEESESEYVFVSLDRFKSMARQGEFLEYRDYEFGMSYGLGWKDVADAVDSDEIAVGLVNLGSIRHVKDFIPEAITILIQAPVDSIERRLRSRERHTEEQIRERLGNARAAEAFEDCYDHVIRNDDGCLDDALEALERVVLSAPAADEVRGTGRGG